MRSITFPYVTHQEIPCPIIPLGIRGSNGWHRILAYVDSGASYSIFSQRLAEEMELRRGQGRAIYVTVGDGSAIPVALYRLPMQIGSHQFLATIGFSPRLGVGFNLLGRQDIFTHFDVTFSDTRRTITFRPVR